MTSLEKIYMFSEMNKLSSAGDIISDLVQELLVENRFGECKEFIGKIDVSLLTPELMIVVLSTTLIASANLDPERQEYYNKVLAALPQYKEILKKYENYPISIPN